MKNILVIGLVGDSYFYECEQLPTKGQTIQAHSLHTEIGGKGFNQAYTIYMLGGNVTFLTALGNDEIGLKVQKEMNSLGVNTKVVIKDGTTPIASIITTKAGDNEVIVYPGVSLTIDDIKNNSNLLKEADIVLLQAELPAEVTNYLLDECYKLGKTIILNPAPASTSIDISKATYLIPNEIEAKMLFGENYISALENSEAVITLGDDGALCFSEGKMHQIPAIKQNVLDSTGAGDVFCGACCFFLANGASLFEASQKANFYASKSVTKKYVIDSIKSLV